VYAVSADGDGNASVAGYAAGSLNGTNISNKNVIVVKFNAIRDALWTHQFGSSAGDGTSSMAADSRD